MVVLGFASYDHSDCPYPINHLSLRQRPISITCVDFSTNEMVKGTSSKGSIRQTSGCMRDSDVAETTEVVLNFISGKQACRELRRGEQGYLAQFLETGEGEGKTVDVDALIDSASDLDDGQ